MELLIVGIVAFALGFALAKLLPRGKPAGGDAESLREQAALAARIQSLEEQKREQKQERDDALRALGEVREQLAAMDAQKQALIEKQADMQALHAQMKLQFERTAAELLEKNAAKLAETSKHSLSDSQKTIAELLNPLKERMSEFQTKVDQSFGQQSNEQRSLKSEIERIMLTSESLTKALRGDVKAQGNWGEVILERILEDAGMEKGRDYVLQGEGLGMKHMESGSAQKPDVIINLPDGKHVIIDAKVSLTHYERFCGDVSEEERALCLKHYLNSVRAHVKGLAERRYHDNEKMKTPECVLMFMPIEGAYSVALQQDRELHSFAWDKKVAIVCPTTLFVTLQTVQSLWKIERQNQNALDIAKRGGELYDKFVGFAESMQALGRQLEGAQSAYEQAFSRLSSGKGSVVKQVEMLKKLGAKASKSIPDSMANAAEGETADDGAAVLALIS